MDKRKIRDGIRLFWTFLFSPIYIPHFLLYCASKKKKLIMSDVAKNGRDLHFKLNRHLVLLYLLHTNSYYRTLFYYRIGKDISSLISWYRPGNRYFNIAQSTRIGEGMALFHPYGTVINAESIGDNFSCLQLTTIGSSYKGRPKIGNNVSLATNVVVVGDVTIGDNSEIGAGSVVVKDIPSNVLAAGNPARVLRENYEKPADR